MITVDAKWGANHRGVPDYEMISSPEKYYEMWYLGIVMENDEHTYVLQERTVSTTAHRYNTLSNISESFKAAIKIPSDVADGTYHIFVGSKDEHDKKWQLVRRSRDVRWMLLPMVFSS